MRSRKVGTNSFFGESVHDILLDAARSCVQSTFIGRSVGIEAVELGNNGFLYTTRSISVARTFQFSTLLDAPPTLVPPRPAPPSTLEQLLTVPKRIQLQRFVYSSMS